MNKRKGGVMTRKWTNAIGKGLLAASILGDVISLKSISYNAGRLDMANAVSLVANQGDIENTVKAIEDANNSLTRLTGHEQDIPTQKYGPIPNPMKTAEPIYQDGKASFVSELLPIVREGDTQKTLDTIKQVGDEARLAQNTAVAGLIAGFASIPLGVFLSCKEDKAPEKH
jgi:hypothetical protein